MDAEAEKMRKSSRRAVVSVASGFAHGYTAAARRKLPTALTTVRTS